MIKKKKKKKKKQQTLDRNNIPQCLIDLPGNCQNRK